MDWNMKASSWGLSELDQEAAMPTVGTVEGSSRFGVDRSKGEFSVDLKLGQVGNSSNEPAVAKWKDVGGGVSKVASSSSSSSPSSGSSKRARAINNGTQTVSCLVDGCNADLSHCRDYHRRHKVCELHSKTPVVTIGGNKQRFCQQCSRFHSLEEFDEGKRSCRKRLDGHNRRRRKPQPDALARSGTFLSNYQGTQVLSFSSSHLYSSNAMAHPAWNGAVTSCAEGRLPSHHHPQPQQMHHLVDKQNLFLGSSSTYKEGNKQQHLAFLQADNSTTMENNNNNNNQSNTALAPPPPPPPQSVVSVCQTFLRTTTPLSSPLHDHDSHCALSLLSSPHAHTSGSGLSQMVQPPHHAMTLMHHHQSLGLTLHDHNLEPVDPVLVHSESDHCPAMYNMNEAPQPFPFHWE